MITRAEATAPPALTPADFIHLLDGPRAGDRLQAPGHTGRICLGLAPNVAPRLGAELIYESAGTKTAEGCRCYRLVLRALPAD